MTMRKLIVTLVMLVTIVAGFTACDPGLATEPVNGPANVQSTPAPIAIPASGEYMDSTAFVNESFILDYQIVNGSASVATLTYVTTGCSDNWHTPINGNNGYWGVDREVSHNTVTVSLSYQQGTLDIYDAYNNASFVGTYDGSGFNMVSSDIRGNNTTGPVNFTFVPYPLNNALSKIETQYQN